MLIPHAFAKSYRPRYTGSIVDNAKLFRLVGAGYAAMPKEQGGYFDISSARHLAGPLRALLDPEVRTVIIIGATQVMKTIAAELWVIYLIEHALGSIAAYFEDDPKAKLFASTRLMPVLREHPVIKGMLRDIQETVDRFQVTKTEISFLAGRKLNLFGMNDGNTSTLSWPYIWISEAWMARPGMLYQAMKRADRYSKTCKILIESQAGDAGEDLDVECQKAHAAPLTWACPYCGGRQTWECEIEYENPRKSDFVAIHPTMLRESAEWSPPKPGSRSGMKFPPAEEVTASGTRFRTIEERNAGAAWECHHCGTLIKDTPELRQKIMDSYEQDYRILIQGSDPPRYRVPSAVMFRIPFEAARDNYFRKSTYLVAKEAMKGNDPTKLAIWYKAERGIAFSLELTTVKTPVITETVELDAKGRIPNECYRKLLVDCQQSKVETEKTGESSTGCFWWIAMATDKSGNHFMLERGYAISWSELFGTKKIKLTDKEGRFCGEKWTGGITDKWSIPTGNVCIDGGNWRQEVKEKAAYYATISPSTTSRTGFALDSWYVMVGSEFKGARHADGIWRPYTLKYEETAYQDHDGKWSKREIAVVTWSNFVFKSILTKMRRGDPGQPKYTACDVRKCNARTQAMEVRNFAYENQMNGFVVGQDDKGKPKIHELHKQQHYSDCSCMGVVLDMIAGKLGGDQGIAAIAAAEAEAQSVPSQQT